MAHTASEYPFVFADLVHLTLQKLTSMANHDFTEPLAQLATAFDLRHRGLV
jgi:hypothetical protein